MAILVYWNVHFDTENAIFDWRIVSELFPHSKMVISEIKAWLQILVFEKTQSNDLFISPKWKKAILEMALKSFILSKLDRQMSKSLKWIVAHEL